MKRLLIGLLTMMSFSTFAQMSNKEVRIENSTYPNLSITVECVNENCSEIEVKHFDEERVTLVRKTSIKAYEESKDSPLFTNRQRQLNPYKSWHYTEPYQLSMDTAESMITDFREGYHLKGSGKVILTSLTLILDTVYFPLHAVMDYKIDKDRKSARLIFNALKDLETQNSVTIRLNHKKFSRIR